MVDGKGILDALLGAAAVNGKQEKQQQGAGGGLGDLLGQVLGGGSPQDKAGDQTGGGLGDLLGQVLGGGSPQTKAGSQTGGGLGDLLGQVLGGGSPQAGAESQTGGGLGDLLGQVLGGGSPQVKTGGQTGGGLGDILGQALGGASGNGGGLLDAVKNAVTKNPGLTQAAIAGMAGLLLTSGKARGLATGAAKLGGIALIGGLAYQALKNFQSKAPAQAAPLPKPENYTPVAASNDGALKMVRTMIAAAMADGEIDAEEQKKILGQMPQDALSEDQKAWLHAELSRPASAKQIADSVKSVQEAVETYTAAQIVIDRDSQPNKAFLDTLAKELALPAQLVAEIDRAIDGVKVNAPA